MKRIYIIFILSLCKSFLGCASLSKSSKGWSKGEVVGLTISLNDPVEEQWYKFHSAGTVSVTYGNKKGALTAPLYNWKVRAGVLQIFDDKKRIFQELRLVKREGHTITVVDKSDKAVEFSVLSEELQRYKKVNFINFKLTA